MINKVCGFICLVVGVVAFFVLLSSSLLLEGLILLTILALAALSCFIGAWLVEVFAQIVEDVHAMRLASAGVVSNIAATVPVAVDDELPEL